MKCANAQPLVIISVTLLPRSSMNLHAMLQDLPCHHVESGVGYLKSFMKYVVYESPALMAWHYGYFANNMDNYWALSEEQRKELPV